MFQCNIVCVIFKGNNNYIFHLKQRLLQHHCVASHRNEFYFLYWSLTINMRVKIKRLDEMVLSDSVTIPSTILYTHYF